MKQSGERHVSSAPQTGRLIEGQRTLEDLKVLQVCILRIDIELHPGHWYIEVDTVEDLAESRAVGSLLVFAIEGYEGRRDWEEEQTYPVPHCSTLVMFSWRRLLSHATSSCLQTSRC